MAEVCSLLVTGPHTARAPSANAYKLIYTFTQQGTIGVHVCQTTGVAAKIRIAVIEPGYAYADGDVPSLYQFWHYDRELQVAPDDFDMTVVNAAIGTSIVVRTDTAGVTFCPHGFLT